jgi:hypothetical protein
MSYQDKITIGEIADNDVEMFDHIVIRNTRKVTFNNEKQALAFMFRCLKAAIKHCGVKDADKMSSIELETAEKWHGIKVEHRDYYRADDDWRNGFYIYKKDELVAFTSDVNGGSRLIYRGLGKMPGMGIPDLYWVVTNVKGM